MSIYSSCLRAASAHLSGSLSLPFPLPFSSVEVVVAFVRCFAAFFSGSFKVFAFPSKFHQLTPYGRWVGMGEPNFVKFCTNRFLIVAKCAVIASGGIAPDLYNLSSWGAHRPPLDFPSANFMSLVRERTLIASGAVSLIPVSAQGRFMSNKLHPSSGIALRLPVIFFLA